MKKANILLTIYSKDSKGKYVKTDTYNNSPVTKDYFMSTYLNALERKQNGASIRIKKHYHYTEKMELDIYYENGWKYSFENVPCYTGANVDTTPLYRDYK